ncbi:MAG: hypothetical protein K8H88_04040 [Sandaracinaceae bacterium]|nr:hypothetical protein [Sandaracinaceae bacterium]
MRREFALFMLLATGCGEAVAGNDAGPGGGAEDAALDGGAEVDAGHDAGPDAGRHDGSVHLPDAGRFDAGRDAGRISDAGTVPDAAAPFDGGVDAGSDAAVDAGSPVPGDAIADLGANGNGSCLRTVTDQMWCWGNRLFTTPTYVADAVELRGTCGVALDGHVFCWGPTGIVDYPGTDASVVGSLAYVARPTGEVRGLGLGSASWSPPVAVASMPAQFCAIHIDGGLTCWDVVDAAVPPSPPSPAFTDFWAGVSGSATYDAVDVARRGAFSTHNIVVCFAWTGTMPGPGGGTGPNVYCATERGTSGSSLFHSSTEVETAGGRTCAISPMAWDDGAGHHEPGVYCTSDSPSTFTATGYAPLNPLPSGDAVGTYTNVLGTDLAVGSNHACIMQGANILCWGQNSYGQLGNGGTSASATPVRLLW